MLLQSYPPESFEVRKPRQSPAGAFVSNNTRVHCPRPKRDGKRVALKTLYHLDFKKVSGQSRDRRYYRPSETHIGCILFNVQIPASDEFLPAAHRIFLINRKLHRRRLGHSCYRARTAPASIAVLPACPQTNTSPPRRGLPAPPPTLP